KKALDNSLLQRTKRRVTPILLQRGAKIDGHSENYRGGASLANANIPPTSQIGPRWALLHILRCQSMWSTTLEARATLNHCGSATSRSDCCTSPSCRARHRA